MIFWHASRQTGPMKPTPQQYKWKPTTTATTNEINIHKDPRTKPAAVLQSSQSVQDFPLQPQLEPTSKPKKSNVWNRLGPEKKEADENWTPENIGDDEQDEDDNEGVFEGANIIRELGNKVVGNEMDTIARTADHPYFLRSLMQSDAGKSEISTSVQPSIIAGTGLPDSTTLYDIPYPNIPLLPQSRGNTAGECYDALDARDQAIRKGTPRICATVSYYTC